MVFNVAMFVDCEVIPIHMPNQVRAQMFAAKASAPPTCTTATTHELGPLNAPLTVTPAGVTLVETTVTFVTVTLVSIATGAGGVREATNELCARCAINPPTNCAPIHNASGIANQRRKARL